MSFLTGKSESKNLAYPYIKDSFGGAATDLTRQGQSGLSQYLATLSGSDAGAGYNTYRNSTGYQNIFDEAMRGVSSNAAARGLMASGSTVRAMQDRAGQLGQQNFAQYLQQILQGSQVGLQSGNSLANTLAGAGQVSKSRGGLLDSIAGLASGVGALTAPGALFGKKG
jgi:hypothetical protein